MYGEPRKIREVAERLERRAAQLRAEADELHTASEGSPWVSAAADRMREHARASLDELVQVAREYDEAAEKVRAHATEVQRLLDLIAAIERQVRAIIGEALGRANPLEVTLRLADGRVCEQPPGDAVVSCDADNSIPFAQ